VADITPKDLKARLDAGEKITVIDVRESFELAITQLDFAKHIPMNSIPERLADVPRDVPVVVMCKVGGRSGQVAGYLQGQGYTNVLNLTGGILRWAADVDPSLPKIY
jgi:adenylyltransferase/sulfurtransferase